METKSSGLLVYVAAGAMLALTGANGFLFWRTSEMEADLSKMHSAQTESASQLLAKNETIKAELQKNLAEINQQIEDTRSKATSAAVSARTTAVKHAEKLAKSINEENVRNQERVTQDIGAVKAAVETAGANAETRFSAVSTEVGSVKAEVDSTKAELEKTIAGLGTVRGDMGVQSGLIATNAKELAALRELGEKNYVEFTIAKTDKAYKVGGVTLTLKKADVKRNKYNVELVADDKRVEKKDKTVNEPVQFYVAGARQPYEIVVNQVAKDKIIGYLATPKVIRAAR